MLMCAFSLLKTVEGEKALDWFSFHWPHNTHVCTYAGLSTGVEFACKTVEKRLDVPHLSSAKQEQHLNNIKREVAILVSGAWTGACAYSPTCMEYAKGHRATCVSFSLHFLLSHACSCTHA
mgnify:CR=1 FL=1